jgi:hypothetical protein
MRNFASSMPAREALSLLPHGEKGQLPAGRGEAAGVVES